MNEDYFNPDFLYVKMHGGLWSFPDGSFKHYRRMDVKELMEFSYELREVSQREQKSIIVKTSFPTQSGNIYIGLPIEPFEPLYKNRLEACG